jgi:predicted ABC-type ATPase
VNSLYLGILVVAGTNGAGKSSVVGERFKMLGADYYDPDAEARRIRAGSPHLSQLEANGLAWREEVALLDRAIANRTNFAFETTLGGRTLTTKLLAAASQGIPIRMWYVALESVELHIQRVRERESRGGHGIPEAAIRRRYVESPKNLIRLLPLLTDLHVYDNSQSPTSDEAFLEPRLLLRIRERKIEFLERQRLPRWAQPIIAEARGLHR